MYACMYVCVPAVIILYAYICMHLNIIMHSAQAYSTLRSSIPFRSTQCCSTSLYAVLLIDTDIDIGMSTDVDVDIDTDPGANATTQTETRIKIWIWA